jgi:hypothetical protein
VVKLKFSEYEWQHVIVNGAIGSGVFQFIFFFFKLKLAKLALSFGGVNGKNVTLTDADSFFKKK